MAESKASKRGRAARRSRGGRRRLADAGTGIKYDVDELPNLDLMASLDRVAKMLARAVGEVARKHGATTSQLQVVAALARAPEGLTAKHLAAALAIRPGSLTGMLDTLAGRGILQRERVKGDARQQRIVLLEGARDLVESLSEVESRIDALFADIGGDTRDELGVLSDRTESHLRHDSSLPMPAVLRITSPVKMDRWRMRMAEKQAAADAAQLPAATPSPVRPAPQAPTSDAARSRRGMLGLSSRVLSAVDAVRKRRDD
ncbi:MAG: MarR family transcriptional regulator [Myxococcales bacterium]|nr:MarR family transcriptional regulator [Myxococcales bacterium]